VNQLRQLMLEELQRRNFAATTIRTYLHGVTHFSRYFRRPPDQLGPKDIRKYQAMLFTKLKYSPNTVTLRLASLRFFYIHVLKRNWSIAETPYPKKVRHLPGVLSQAEVARLIDAADTPFHRVLLMTLYATGARRAEAANLKVSDIDSQRMVVHIREGKGGRDRDVMLSPKLLEALRDYWRGLRRKPKEWLFPGNRWHTSSHPVTTKVLWSACQIAAERAGLAQKNSRVFRGKFVAGLRNAFHRGALKFHGDLLPLAQPRAFAAWRRVLFRQDWVVYSKRPFGGPEHALRYLGAYTHRAAISNSRLVALADGNVTFRWRDSAHSNRKRLMTLPVEEFLRRFLLHLLPPGFVRIRNFGFLANRRRATLLPLCFELLGGSEKRAVPEASPSAQATHSLWNCPVCGGTMHVVERLSAAQLLLRSPPEADRCAA
jgi:integrase/recombinase XerD